MAYHPVAVYTAPSFLPVEFRRLLSDALGSTEPGEGYIPVTGGTLQGPLVLAGDGTDALNPVSVQQFNAVIEWLEARIAALEAAAAP